MDDVSYADYPRMTYRVVIEEGIKPNKSDLKSIALEIWGNGNKEWKGKYRK